MKFTETRGEQKPAKTDPPDKTTRPIHPPVSTYMDRYGFYYFSYSGFGRATGFVFFVRWISDPPDH